MATAFDFPPSQPGGRICVVGAGFMGCVIATLYARHGYEVVINDVVASMLDSYVERARPIAATFSDDPAEIEAILSRVSSEPALEAATKGAFLVHEVVQEVLEIKQALFEQLDGLCPADVIIATNTSSFLLSEIAARVTNRQRVMGIHYVTPAHIVRVVELIHAEFTPPALVQWGRDFLENIDHVGVACPERPGFLVNKMQFAMLSEIYRLLDEGLTTRDDIDAVFRLSLGPRLALWGPLLTEDLVVSKKTALAVTDSIYERTGEDQFKGRKVLRDMVEKGDLGALTGNGWYKFSDPYPDVVEERDKQLSELLEWLRERGPVEGVGAR